MNLCCQYEQLDLMSKKPEQTKPNQTEKNLLDKTKQKRTEQNKNQTSGLETFHLLKVGEYQGTNARLLKVNTK